MQNGHLIDSTGTFNLRQEMEYLFIDILNLSLNDK